MAKTKKGFGQYLRVGFFLIVIGFFATIISTIILIPIAILTGMVTLSTIDLTSMATLTAGGILLLFDIIIRLVVLGYFATRWKGLIYGAD